MEPGTISPHDVRKQLNMVVEPPTLSPAEKIQVAANRVPISFVGGKAGVLGKHGESYLMTAKTGDYRYKFFMGSPGAKAEGDNPHPEVDEELQWICDNASESSPVGPYALEYITMKNAQSFFRLVPFNPLPVFENASQEALPFG